MQYPIASLLDSAPAKLNAQAIAKRGWFMESGFSHRFKANGSIDSICHRCFATVGTAFEAADLERIEDRHTCIPSEQSRYDVMLEEAKLHSQKQAQ